MGFESAASALHARDRQLGRCPCDSDRFVAEISSADFYSSRKANFDSLRLLWDEHNQRRAKEFASANKNWPSTLRILCFSVS